MKQNKINKKINVKLNKLFIFSILIMGLFVSIAENKKFISIKPESASVPLILGISIKIDDQVIKIYDRTESYQKRVRIPLNSKITISVKTQDHCTSMKLFLTGGGLKDIEYNFNKASSTIWEYYLDTSNTYGTSLPKGLYDFNFVLSDGSTSNEIGEEGYSFNKIMELYNKQVEFLLYFLIAIAIAAVSITLIIFRIKRKRREKVVFSKSTGMTKRKREIYSGASSIGKLDGKMAETKMAVRKTSSSVKLPIEETVNRKSGDSSLSKLPEALQIKMEESKVDVLTRSEFLDSKIDNLGSQLDILNTIVDMIQESSKCPLCGNPIRTDWEICPYCTIKENEEEINLKKSSLQLKKRVRSKCPKCGLILDPNWIECPKCFVDLKLKSN